MSGRIAFTVQGTPTPQGSKRAIHHRTTGRIIMMEDQNARVKSWRAAVRNAARDAVGANHQPLTGPIHIALTFQLRRPNSHYGTGRNADTLKASAPRWPAKMPDLDKLTRATFDALTDAGIWADDGQVVMADITKRYGLNPGAQIRITDIDSLKDAVAQAIHSVGGEPA